jgi:hypothetical protein
MANACGKGPGAVKPPILRLTPPLPVQLPTDFEVKGPWYRPLRHAGSGYTPDPRSMTEEQFSALMALLPEGTEIQITTEGQAGRRRRPFRRGAALRCRGRSSPRGGPSPASGAAERMLVGGVRSAGDHRAGRSQPRLLSSRGRLLSAPSTGIPRRSRQSRHHRRTEGHHPRRHR